MFIKQSLYLLIALTLLACYPKVNDKAVTTDIAFKYYSRAVEQYQAKNFTDALVYIDQAIDKNRRIAKYYEFRGDINFKQGQFEEALDDYQNAINLRSFYPDAYIKKGIIFNRSGRFDDAIRSYRKALAQRPDQLDLILRIVDNYIQQRQSEIAQNQLADYKTSVLKSKKNINREFYILQAKIDFEKSDYISVVENINVAKKYEMLNRNECVFYLRALIETNELEEAYTLASQQYKNVLSEADLHYLRGLYFVRNDNIKDAKTQLELSVSKKTKIPEVYILLSEIYNSENNSDLEAEMKKRAEEFSSNRLINLGLTE